MIKPSIKRWKINQAMLLLKLRAGSLYEDFINKLTSKKIRLPSPVPDNTRRGSIQQQESFRRAQSSETSTNATCSNTSSASTSTSEPAVNTTNATATTAVDSSNNAEVPSTSAVPKQLPPTYVPPINAPTQHTEIPLTSDILTGKLQQCKYWPICGSDARLCGGTVEGQCKVLGNDPPSTTEVTYQSRLRTWSRKAINSDCAWVICGKAIKCGGLIKAKCSKYGDNGTHIESRPTEKEMKEAKKKKEAARKRAARELKRQN